MLAIFISATPNRCDEFRGTKSANCNRNSYHQSLLVFTKPELANPFEIFLAFVDAGLSYDNLAARASPVDADPRLSDT